MEASFENDLSIVLSSTNNLNEKKKGEFTYLKLKELPKTISKRFDESFNSKNDLNSSITKYAHESYLANKFKEELEKKLFWYDFEHLKEYERYLKHNNLSRVLKKIMFPGRPTILSPIPKAKQNLLINYNKNKRFIKK